VRERVMVLLTLLGSERRVSQKISSAKMTHQLKGVRAPAVGSWASLLYWRNDEITMLRASDHREFTRARWREDGLSDTAADRRWPRMALSHANSRWAQRRRSMLLRWERNEAAQRIVLVSTRATSIPSILVAAPGASSSLPAAILVNPRRSSRSRKARFLRA